MITTIERLIARHAATHPDKIAIATPHEQLTYAAFNEAINRRADAFTALDNKAQLFASSQTPGFLIDYFAMHRAGVVAVGAAAAGVVAAAELLATTGVSAAKVKLS